MSQISCSHEEDQTSHTLASNIEILNQTQISKQQSKQCKSHTKIAKQCDDRWLNSFASRQSKKPMTKNQQHIIFEMHKIYGNKWKQIAQQLASRQITQTIRTQNNVKNFFYATLRKGLRRLNKIIGAKFELSRICQVKPKVLSKILPTNSNIQDLFHHHQVIDLIHQLSRLASIQNEDLIQDNQLIKQSQTFLANLLHQNQQYTKAKAEKRKKRKNKKQIHEQIAINQQYQEPMAWADNIFYSLCLGDSQASISKY